jgi:hypothetical protein
MTKFTREQSRQTDQAVKETIVKRLTYLEALDYIKATLGLFNKCQDILY